MEYGSWKSNPNFIFYQINNSFFSNINYLEVACQLWKGKIQKKLYIFLIKFHKMFYLIHSPDFHFCSVKPRLTLLTNSFSITVVEKGTRDSAATKITSCVVKGNHIFQFRKQLQKTQTMVSIESYRPLKTFLLIVGLVMIFNGFLLLINRDYSVGNFSYDDKDDIEIKCSNCLDPLLPIY